MPVPISKDPEPACEVKPSPEAEPVIVKEHHTKQETEEKKISILWWIGGAVLTLMSITSSQTVNLRPCSSTLWRQL